MTLHISDALLIELHAHVEAAYPGEGAGFLLGSEDDGIRKVSSILKLTNAREEEARFNRFLLTPENYLSGEMEAERTSLTLLGVFHSHPDCPNRPSEYDREWAMPWFSYIITRVDGDGFSGKAVSDLCWLLEESREKYSQEEILIG